MLRYRRALSMEDTGYLSAVSQSSFTVELRAGLMKVLSQSQSALLIRLSH